MNITSYVEQNIEVICQFVSCDEKILPWREHWGPLSTCMTWSRTPTLKRTLRSLVYLYGMMRNSYLEKNIEVLCLSVLYDEKLLPWREHRGLLSTWVKTTSYLEKNIEVLCLLVWYDENLLPWGEHWGPLSNCTVCWETPIFKKHPFKSFVYLFCMIRNQCLEGNIEVLWLLVSCNEEASTVKRTLRSFVYLSYNETLILWI